MIVAGECRPVVVPMPDCWTAYGGSQFIDSAGTGNYMTYLCDELVPFVDERFATIAERDAPRRPGQVVGRLRGADPRRCCARISGAGSATSPATPLSSTATCRTSRIAWAKLREHDSIEEFWDGDARRPEPVRRHLRGGQRDRDGRLLLPGPRRRSRASLQPRGLLAARGRLGAVARRGTRCACSPEHLDDAAARCARSRSSAGSRTSATSTRAPRSCTRSSSEAGIEHRFELFEGKHGHLTRRYAPLVAWLAERLA